MDQHQSLRSRIREELQGFVRRNMAWPENESRDSSEALTVAAAISDGLIRVVVPAMNIEAVSRERQRLAERQRETW